jgi:hypothetical protein
MPPDHQKSLEWNGDRFRRWAEQIGINTAKVVDAMLTSRSVEQQAYRGCMGLLHLSEKYSEMKLEAACLKALEYTKSPSYKNVKDILAASSQKDPKQKDPKDEDTHKNSHGITRGAGYYRR